ncbi:MAG: hypothetical protein Tp1123SUR197351_26 [Prokaryotic dsDNA virus sp.]|nr:MAG: hypothetical protein Tp1123SUR197351_26 [Prokaryotic dsDNA virus sp.]QDP57545.1 MAG: hypothetical protein Tp1124SUR703682_16 [Prokaryotic dsDNA virus sp.]|tara:strand:- start:1595 stop:1852 length:258 start_codon:yes stop_codon:yes gene_type:complete
MAFTFNTLSRVCQGAGFTQYMYATSDAKNTVDASGYFNGASEFLNVNDVILVKASDGVGQVIVNANSGGTVDTGDVDAITATDSR